jgi:hypothetical protein
VASYPLLSQAPTPVEVELGCGNRHKYNQCNISRFNHPARTIARYVLIN